jgi:trans-2,3-dihydro-3-hydroxyanthranilate isomerase
VQRYPFVITDVFTDALFSGNQLAVVTDARGLSTQQMQNIAREFNFAESTFVLPADAERARPVIRIFTPTLELPFAGHPTIGTAAVLSFLQLSPPADADGTLVYEEKIGPIRLRVRPAQARTVFAELEITSPLESGPSPDLAALAAAISLPQSAISTSWCAGIGIPFTFVHLANAQTVDAVTVDRKLWQAGLSACPAQVFLFSGNFEDGGTLYARMLAPAFGIEEDAATGSACVGLVASLAARIPLAEAVLGLTIHQGVAMGRPSLLQVCAHRMAGRTQQVRLGGNSVIVAEGSITV